MASIAGHRVTGYADLGQVVPDVRYFTFLREPLKLAASRFQYHVEHRGKRGLVFDDWVRQEWLRNAQTRRIAGTDDAAAAIEVIRRKDILVGLAECFDESLVLLRGLRAPDLEIGYTSVNVAPRSILSRELLAQERVREAIADANGADLELYEYVRSQLFPTLQREYGASLQADVAAFRHELPRGWRRRRLATCRLKQRALYQPALRAHRHRTKRASRR